MKYDIVFGVILNFLFYSILFSSCNPSLPKEDTKLGRNVNVYPDYNGAVIPPNIAPLNFRIDEEADQYLTHIYTSRDKGFVLSGKVVHIPLNKWKRLLSTHKGDTLYTEVYLKKGERWFCYLPVKNWIAPEEIDPYIAYRLIEPSYVSYETMTINQRNLTNFEERILYDNSRLSEGENGQCVNCHSFQNYNKSGNMQMHLRQNLGGTLIVTGNQKAYKVNLKTPYTISPGVYPSWHPNEMYIAYSVNATGQDFHTKDLQKIEVLDFESCLILYDINRNEIREITNEKNEFETYPSWSSDGTTLYYVSAHYEPQSDNIDAELSSSFKDLKYNIFSKSFDLSAKTFGKTDTLFRASDYGKSATLPRESPDGRYLLFSMGDYGNFHIWHKSSDLYSLDLVTKEIRPLQEINSTEAESYHSWSSNGRWIIFSSRREDGSYTRLYIAYFNTEGIASKAFILPQKEPDHSINLFKSFNLPEFMVSPVKMDSYSFMQAIEKDPVDAVYVYSGLHEPEKPFKNEKGDFYE